MAECSIPSVVSTNSNTFLISCHLACPKMTYPYESNRTRSSSGARSGTSIVRQSSDNNVMQSTSRRRLEHYSAQRAQDARDAMPLIETNNRFSSRTVSYYPSSPPPSYQPHQLIAVCFNHMAGRDCEHCRNLDHSLNGPSADHSPDSHHTLGYHGQSNGNQRYSNASLHDEKQKIGGEKGPEQGSPPVVGFWHSRLGKLRLQLLGLWARTSI